MDPSSVDNTPIEPGCPHCGHGTPHPNTSSFPIVPTAQTVVPSSPPPILSLGQIAYDKWVALVGHAEFAVPWDDLGIIGKNAWTGAAGEVAKHVLASPQMRPSVALAQAISKNRSTIS